MTKETPVQPALTDLLGLYLQQQAQAQAAGLAVVDPCGEVTPYEAGPVQPIEAKLAWEEALAVLALYHPPGHGQQLKPPPGWPQLVAAQEPLVALPLAFGNFPQLVRHFHLVLHHEQTTSTGTHPSLAVPELQAWAKKVADKNSFPEMLAAVGTLRLARQWDGAAALVEKSAKGVPAPWAAAWANEKAALAWQRGQQEEALASWQAQKPSVFVLFNRGMAALFLNRPEKANASLTQAVAQLPENGGWHHLGSLYLALAK